MRCPKCGAMIAVVPPGAAAGRSSSPSAVEGTAPAEAISGPPQVENVPAGGDEAEKTAEVPTTDQREEAEEGAIEQEPPEDISAPEAAEQEWDLGGMGNEVEAEEGEGSREEPRSGIGEEEESAEGEEGEEDSGVAEPAVEEGDDSDGEESNAGEESSAGGVQEGELISAAAGSEEEGSENPVAAEQEEEEDREETVEVAAEEVAERPDGTEQDGKLTARERALLLEEEEGDGEKAASRSGNRVGQARGRFRSGVRFFRFLGFSGAVFLLLLSGFLWYRSTRLPASTSGAAKTVPQAARRPGSPAVRPPAAIGRPAPPPESRSSRQTVKPTLEVKPPPAIVAPGKKLPVTPTGPLYPLEPFLIPFNSAGQGDRILKVTLALELSGNPVSLEIDDKKTRLREQVMEVIRSRKLSSLLTPQGKDELRRELVRSLNRQLSTGSVRNVYFTEFVVL